MVVIDPMKFCTHCGKELMDDAVICLGCGCPVENNSSNLSQIYVKNGYDPVRVLSQRVKTNGIVWLVIGVLQILGGIFINWFLLIVGVLNVISSVNDINYSRAVLNNPVGIIEKFEPLTGPVITLVYNLIIGGVIGVIGSIYYFAAVRSFVIENKQFFKD